MNPVFQNPIRRILICGAGHIAHEHARAAITLNPPPALAAADPSPEARAKFAAEFPQAELFTSLEAMLATDGGSDEVVIVATPPWLHRTQTLAALRTERHVLCEKPLALNPAEVSEMLAEARVRGLHLACCSSRFLGRPVLAAAQTAIAARLPEAGLRVTWRTRFHASRSGVEYQPATRWFLDKSKSGGGCLFDWGPYDITTLHSVLQPTEVEVRAAWLGFPERGAPLPPEVVFNVEAQVAATLRYRLPDGREVQVDYERSTASFGPPIATFLFEGPRGAVSWDWLDWDGHAVRTYADAAGVPQDETQAYPDPAGVNAMGRPVLHFAARLAGTPDTSACVDGQAAFNFNVLAAIYTAAREDRIVTLRRADFGPG